MCSLYFNFKQDIPLGYLHHPVLLAHLCPPPPPEGLSDYPCQLFICGGELRCLLSATCRTYAM